MPLITTGALVLLVVVCVTLIASGLFHAARLDDPEPVLEDPMAKQSRAEVSSARVAAIAARALKAPSSLTMAEIKALAASVLTQRPTRRRR